MPPEVFEPTVPVSERPQTDALDGTATGIGNRLIAHENISHKYRFCETALYTTSNITLTFLKLKRQMSLEKDLVTNCLYVS
jgi:hypothetical protein